MDNERIVLVGLVIIIFSPFILVGWLLETITIKILKLFNIMKGEINARFFRSI